jgi:hypothetical protein
MSRIKVSAMLFCFGIFRIRKIFSRLCARPPL